MPPKNVVHKHKSWKLLEHVKFLLTGWEHLRDNDEALVCNVWARELMHKYDKDYVQMSAKEMMLYLVDKKLTSSASIRRARRKIQEDNPNLRGNRYLERKVKATERMKQNLGYETTRE